tara:strand:+ start:559 stop:885 length:327 start_codon:yes stop_codon:yes gene_type:complete
MSSSVDLAIELEQAHILKINLEKDYLINWFGDRGQPIIDNNFKHRMIEKNGEQWVFITDDCFADYDSRSEVELYYLNSIHCECYNSWQSKDFSWYEKDLLSYIPKEDS